MKSNIYPSRIFAFLLTFLSSTLFGEITIAQVTVSGGTTAAGSYTTIAAAVTALNGSGATGNITMDVLAGYSETAPL